MTTCEKKLALATQKYKHLNEEAWKVQKDIKNMQKMKSHVEDILDEMDADESWWPSSIPSFREVVGYTGNNSIHSAEHPPKHGTMDEDGFMYDAHTNRWIDKRDCETSLKEMNELYLRDINKDLVKSYKKFMKIADETSVLRQQMMQRPNWGTKYNPPLFNGNQSRRRRTGGRR